MLADKPTELSRIKLKTWTRQPVPMVSEHSAHLTPLSVDFCTWLWRYTYLLLLISMLWHRQEIFKSKGDKLCSSAESRIWTRDPRHQIASRLNARWQTDWAIEDQAKNLNSTARPNDQRAFSPLDPTVSWLWQVPSNLLNCLLMCILYYRFYDTCGSNFTKACRKFQRVSQQPKQNTLSNYPTYRCKSRDIQTANFPKLYVRKLVFK